MSPTALELPFRTASGSSWYGAKVSALEPATRRLFQAPLTEFVAVRKQLASELKQGGDVEAARRIGAYKRPTVSAWVVNQLWWHERDSFEAFLENARLLGTGDLGRSSEHHRLLASLRSAASRLLVEHGHAANDGTLRKVLGNLAALAVAGGFAPALDGALARDRDPPGFEAVTLPSGAAAPPALPNDDGTAAERAAAERAAAERARRDAERKRLQAELAGARAALEASEARAAELERELESVRRDCERATALVNDLETRWAGLTDD